MQEDGWFDTVVHQQLCDFIQYHIEETLKDPAGDTTCYLLVILPRGSLKSTIVTKYLPVWLTLRDPNFRSLIATNTVPNARKKLEDIRGLFDTHSLFRTLWPELLPKRMHRWTNESAEVNRTMSFPEATFEGCGMKTKKTGTHYNLIIEDDTTAPDDSDMGAEVVAPSIDDIDRAIGWHKSSTALLVPKGPRIRVVVTTRWSDQDLARYIKDNEQKYRIFDVPAQTESGQSVFQIFYSKEALKDIESQLGPYLYSALFLNRPIDASLRVFQDQWLKQKFNPDTDLPPGGSFTIAIDPAISEKDEACETAITKVYHHSPSADRWNQYWCSDVHGHMLPSKTVDVALDLAESCPETPKAIYIESNAYQAALKYYMWDAMSKRDISIPIIPFASHTAKSERIQGMQPYFASGRVFLSSTLTKQVESQLRQFPHGKLVDIIDCFSFHRRWYRKEKQVIQAKPKPQVELYSWDSVMSELRDRARNKRGAGLLTQSSDSIFPLLQTGLGMDRDLELVVGGIR